MGSLIKIKKSRLAEKAKERREKQEGFRPFKMARGMVTTGLGLIGIGATVSYLD